MNNPIYKIHGKERRLLKKELTNLKQFSKYFNHFHQLDKDMVSFYKTTNNYPMTDNEAQIKLNNVKDKISKIEKELTIKHIPT
jgi:protein subunit release factor A